ncbi:MAG TPA: SnoaL-like domain-containing protein [Chitinophagaceae bacterium]|nr:SnoaL-like domain-containing protein [Chitinophagaceae bacterium]
MSNVKQHIEHLNQLVLQGKALEAFEKYYDDEVVMQENNLAPTDGKEANRLREIDFYNSIDARSAEILGTTYGDDISAVIWKYDYTHKDWGVRDYTQVSVQYWKNGKIVKEQFFYGN